jgi:SAM-dependent methyltransferase
VDEVASHYTHARLLDAILAALESEGKDAAYLTPADLAPVDEFHLRGREATLELARLAQPAPGLRVLDVGCGLGGSARHLAYEHGCRVDGVDLTPAYVDVATELTRRVGLADRVAFQQASALALPFADGEFDVVWTEHVQMNIADKHAFYAELARVLKPGGRLVFHDVFQGAGGTPHFPVPWADEPTISHLVDVDGARQAIVAAGFEIAEWRDMTERSLDWLTAVAARRAAGAKPALGLHLLMGENARRKGENNVLNLREGRIVVAQAVCVCVAAR